MNSARLSKIGSIAIAGNSLMEDHWPPNLSDLNPLDKHVWEAMLNAISCKIGKKDKRIECCIGVNMDYLPMESINKATTHVKKRLRATIHTGGGHIAHML